MNRVTRLVHKARFLSRQRRALAYSRRYVVTANDIDKWRSVPPPDSSRGLDEAEHARMLDEILAGFDLENSKIDRRLFYEITGRQLIEDEFEDGSSSGSEGWAKLDTHDAQIHAFTYDDSG